MNRTVGVLCLAVILVVAGCSGGATTTATDATSTTEADPTPTTATTAGTETATQTTSTGATESENDVDGAVRVYGDGELPTEAGVVYGRVANLTGWDPSGVNVYVEKAPDEDVSITASDETFAGVLGLTPPENASTGTISGYASYGDVYVFTANNTPDQIEATLAHEFTHRLQYSEFSRIGVDGNRRQMFSVLLEGGAEVVERAYAERYLEKEPSSPSESREWYRSAPAYQKYAYFEYTVGYAYVANHSDSPSDLDPVYMNPPQTTEEVIHDLEPGSEPPMNLSLSVRPGGDRYSSHEGTQGEFLARVALNTELSWNRSARAGTGWGADSLASVHANDDDETVGYAWATRWDTVEDADEFETAMLAYLDSRANRSSAPGVWRDDDTAFTLVRGSDDVVVLVAGDPGYVANATVAVDGAAVTVTQVSTGNETATTTNATVGA